MIQRISKRFLSLLLTAVMVLALVPAVTLPAFAASSGEVAGLANENVGLTYSGDEDDTWSASGTTITGSIQSSSGCGTTHYSSTLTITNKRSIPAALSFDYAIDAQGGTIQVDGTAVTAGGTFSKELAAGGTATVYIKSNSTSAPTKITLSNVALSANVEATATFLPAENGSYTVNGKAVTEEFSNTQNAMSAYKLVATPASGYQFRGWYNVTTGEYLGTDTTLTLNVESDCTITAQFLAEDANLFEAGTQTYEDLGDAVAYAQENKISQITLLSKKATLTKDYTIPAGITLLVPHDAAKSLFLDSPTALSGGSVSNKNNEYKRLTLAEGVTLTVQGGLSVGGQHRSCAGSSAGYMTGNYGQVWLNAGSSIIVENGGNLYAWGFVSGAGSVTVKSGGTAYEWYQITDFRGGSASIGMGNKVFPFSQYYVQNIETALILEQGASEKVYAAVFASSRINYSMIPFVGDDGMFKVVSGSLIKQYDGTTDRIIYTVNGQAEVNNLNLSLAGSSVSSKNYVLPLTNNMTVNLTAGSKLTINQTAALLPGVQANIAQGAEMTISSGNSVYVYDRDEWVADSYTCSGKFVAVKYSPSKTYNRTDADLVDAKVNIDGTLSVDGTIYTTASGADICSTGTGVFKQNAALGTETTTYQYTQSGSSVTAHKIAITSAKLHNADGSYTETAKITTGTTIPYVDGVWGGTAKATVSFDPNGGTGSMAPMEVQPGTKINLTQNTFIYDGYTFTGWNTAADGSGTSYADKGEITVTEDTTLYAQWTQNPVITFDANGGEGTMGKQTVKPNVAAALIENTFTRADYDFAGWNTAADGSGTAYADKAEITTNTDITLYAQWTLHKYHVRWLNLNGTVLKEGNYTCEDNASYDMWFEEDPEPQMPEDENYTYKFLTRWTPYDEEKGINGWGFYPHQDVDFTAVYNKFEKLTVTFDANGGTGTMESVKIANGASGKFYTLPECGFTREGYTFDGWLITGTVGYSAFSKSGLVEEKWEDNDLLAFSNLTLKASWKMLENGWYAENDNYYYRLNGKLVTGMVRVPYPAADLLPGYGPDAEDAEVNVPGKDGNPDNYDYPDRESALFVFDKNGVFQKDQCGVYNDNGVTRWINNGMLVWHAGLVKDGDDYRYFKRNGMVTSVETYVAKTNDLLKAAKYTFDAEGKLMKLEGLHEDLNGNLCYYVDYVKSYAGLVEVDGSFYYIASDLKAVKNGTYYVTKTNGLKDAGFYSFDADGKMIIKNGLAEENGDLYYYVDGSKTAAGLIEWEGNYYYIASNLKAVKDAKHYVFADRANGLKSAGWYWFNADGTMFLEGIREEIGTKYYYKDGVKNYVGLIEISGEYYYVKSDCSVVCDRSYYVTKSNGLMPSATYTFDADGKMVIKNGIYREKLGDGNEYLFYYVNNVRQVGTGLVQLEDGSYIYVRSGANLAVGSYYVSKTNDLLPKGTYTFGEDGKMVVEP